jgi:anaerobic dimethyl sulfoxide reductase subunit C
MRDRSLVVFTLLAQSAVGLAWALAAVCCLGTGAMGSSGAEAVRTPFLAVGPLILAAAGVSLLHLGTPRRALRALSNLRASWLSREILFLGLFAGGWALLVALQWSGSGSVAPDHPRVAEPGPGGAPGGTVVGAMAAVVAAGAGLLYSMSRVYRLRTVPAWDSRLTTGTFFLSAGALGSLVAALILDPTIAGDGVIRLLAVAGGTCLAFELWLEPAWNARRSAAFARVDPGLRIGGSPQPPALQRVLYMAALALVLAVALGASPGGPLLAGALAMALAAIANGRLRFYESHARLGL